MGDNLMNKSAYEAPDMVKRMVSTANIAAGSQMSEDDNYPEGDVDWTN